jgi:hypothetical protein
VTYTHLDYITLTRSTYGIEDNSTSDELWIWAKEVCTGGQAGEATTDATVLGYRGWQCGSMFYGRRYDGEMCRVSGGASHLLYPEMTLKGWRASRIDIAVDVFVPRHKQSDMLEAYQDFAREHRVMLKGRPYRVEMRRNEGENGTLYVGARTSSQYVRLYRAGEKHGEDYRNILRFEVECKERLAHWLWGVLETCTDDAVVLGSLASELLAKRGIVLPSPLPNPDGWTIPRFKPGKSSLESTLLWFERQVRPTVRRLMNEDNRGTILASLGLSDVPF